MMKTTMHTQHSPLVKWLACFPLLWLSACSLVETPYSPINFQGFSFAPWDTCYPLPYCMDSREMKRDLSSPYASNRYQANLYFKNIGGLRQCSQAMKQFSETQRVALADCLYNAFCQSLADRGVDAGDTKAMGKADYNYPDYPGDGLDRFISWRAFYASLPTDIRKELPEEQARIYLDMHCARILIQHIEQNPRMPGKKRRIARNIAVYILNHSDGGAALRGLYGGFEERVRNASK